MEQLPLVLAPPPAPTLDNFVVGANGAALAALRELVADPSPERSAYLWGPPGSGRTHLLEATARALTGAGVTVRRLASPGALPHGERFVLLLDDVDTLDTTAQIAAFEAAHAARAAGGAVLAAGPAPARELALREDLRSRLAQCVNLPLAALSEEEARAALEAQAAALGFPLDRALSDYLMQRARRDMGTLSSLLAALDRRSLSLQRPLTVALVREVLRDNERMSPSGSTAS